MTHPVGDPQSAAVTEVVVNDRDIRTAASLIDGLDSAAGLRDDSHVGLVAQQPADPETHRGVIIGDQHANALIRPGVRD